jgi:hypothetical protein
MPSPDELRAHIAEGRTALRSAIQTSGDRWEQTIPGDDWSPRKAAEHAIGAEVYFASEVCSACGYPGLDPWTGSYATPADAIAGLDQAAAAADGRLKYVSDTDLVKSHPQMGTVTDIMTIDARHLLEHAEQLRGAGQ